MEPNTDPMVEVQSQHTRKPDEAAVPFSGTRIILLVLCYIVVPLCLIPLMIFFRDPDVVMIFVAVLLAGHAFGWVLRRQIAQALVMALLALSFLLGILFQDPLAGKICFAAGMVVALVNMVVLLYGSIRERKIAWALLGPFFFLVILLMLAVTLTEMFA